MADLRNRDLGFVTKDVTRGYTYTDNKMKL